MLIRSERTQENRLERVLGFIKMPGLTYKVSLISEVRAITLSADIDSSELDETKKQELIENNLLYLDEVAISGKSKDIVLDGYHLNVFLMRVEERTHSGNVRVREILTGVNANSVHKAFDRLKNKPVELDDIAVVLESHPTHPIPSPIEFDLELKRQFKKEAKLPRATSMSGIHIHGDVLSLIKAGKEEVACTK